MIRFLLFGFQGGMCANTGQVSHSAPHSVSNVLLVFAIPTFLLPEARSILKPRLRGAHDLRGSSGR